MTKPLDVLAIGNAIVDVIATADDAFLAAQSLDKGSMRLIDAAEAERLYGVMGPGREVSGGSGANAAAGIAALGGQVAFIGRVADDQLGQVFAHDIRAAGVDYLTPFANSGNPTARCLILVTPDAQRTMNTFLGASQDLTEADVDYELVRQAGITYLEGYLWDPPAPRAAMAKALKVAREAGNRVAFTLSDAFCVERHRDDFLMLADGNVDVLFANEVEIKSLYQTDDFDTAIAAIQGKLPIAVVTRSEKGALVVTPDGTIAVPAEPVSKIVDTTGAGDLFAAGFLAGLSQARPLADCARLGAIAAAEVISHYGARPEADLKALAAKVTG
ncbi:adenosine kinase [Sphingoaurantiacus capsulatus]|uniref:Adenosine kinase n=1 Tax=Sphingoaurantiacus capsulatus TaxID=1771310 RepID=A0ABV7XHC4_9SPHN